MRGKLTEIGRTYFQLLQEGQPEKIIRLFAADATVDSPLYGTMSARDFYNNLADETNNSVLQVKEIFPHETKESVAVTFDYEWELTSGETVYFTGVDILEFDPQLKIKKLTIIYDTVKTREARKSL